MSRTPARLARIFFCFICLACGHAAPAWAQYEVEQDDRVWLRAMLDARLVRAGPAPSWTDTGVGKLRYGGKVVHDMAGGSPRFERVTRGVLSQLALEIGAALPGQIRAHAQVNVQPDLADGFEPWLIEAILRREWGDGASGWALQGGVMNLPFSLEHVGPAWSPEYTLTASALNSWLWEEASLAGVEGEWWRETGAGLRIGVLAGAGFGPDRMARLLALRGWAMGDGLSGINADLPLPGRTERMDIFHERDDRPAVYTWLSISDRRDIAALKLGYFDNRGDQDTAGVWHTRFSVVGLSVHPHPNVDLLAQWLDGTARVAAPDNDSSLQAYYALVSWHQARHRVSARYDSWRIRDLDGAPFTRDNGDGVTVSWQMQLSLRHRVAFEHTWLDSRRPASGVADPTRDGWQLSYRFRY